MLHNMLNTKPVAIRATSSLRRFVVASNNTSSSTTTTVTTSRVQGRDDGSHELQTRTIWSSVVGMKQQAPAQLAAASGTAVALAAIAPSTYHVLSSATLPPISLVMELLGACLTGMFTVAKLMHGDNVHLELHKGRFYVQLGVPKSGPALQPGSIITQPTGDVRGNGAYATQLIPSGTHIADYAGEHLSNDAFFSRYPDGVGDYVMAIDQDHVIDAAAWVATTDSFHPVHMNHSRQRHNVVRYYDRSQGRVAFFASRDIQRGEELLYDYGRAYWKNREHLELP